MLELPAGMRELLIEQLDEYCENMDDTSDTDAIAEAVVELVESVAQEVSGVDAEEIISKLETSGELDASLVEVLEEHFAKSASLEFSGEDIVTMLEKICEIEWSDPDDDEGGSGFFGEEPEGEEDF
jgi:hypothetical protein